MIEGLVERDFMKLRASASLVLGKASIASRSSSLRVIGCAGVFDLRAIALSF